MISNKYYDTLVPYPENTDYQRNRMNIQYSNCCEYTHISRYSCLREINHSYKVPKGKGEYAINQFSALESVNPIHSNMDVVYYTVRAEEENRLDLIAAKYLGSARYAWVIAYINEIHDGFSVFEGTRLKIPASRSVISLMDSGEMLEAINPLMLNLGEE